MLRSAMNNLLELAAHLARTTPLVKAEPETLLQSGHYKLKRLGSVFYIMEGLWVIHTEQEEWRAREFFQGLEAKP